MKETKIVGNKISIKKKNREKIPHFSGNLMANLENYKQFLPFCLGIDADSL